MQSSDNQGGKDWQNISDGAISPLHSDNDDQAGGPSYDN
jgi:hypothetical protein